MSDSRKTPLERWRDRPPGGAGIEDLAAERFRSVNIPVPDDVMLSRVATRIVAVVEERESRFGIGRLRFVGLAVFLGSAVTAGAAAVHYVKVVRKAQLGAVSTPTQVEHIRRAPPIPEFAAPATQPEPEVALPLPIPEPEPVVVEPARPRVALRHQPVPERQVAMLEPAAPQPVASTPVEPDALAGESQLLHSALERLNLRGDATGALALLDVYRGRFPNGVLAREADVARLDALLRLGDSHEALGLLDRAAASDFKGYPRVARLRILRGELMAQSGRCREAEPIFSAALSDAPATDLAERALYGRASCRAALGDPEGSRADLDKYLKAYPRGHFAREARQALER